MADREEVAQMALQAVYSVIDEMNEEFPEEQRLAKDPSTLIFGEQGGIESIDLVRLVVLYEQEIAEVIGIDVSISDDRAMSGTHSHFATVATLVDYAIKLIKDEDGVD